MLSTLANMRTNARVLDASLDALSSQSPDKLVAEPAVRSAPGPVAYAISQVPCLRAPEGTRCAAWCHAAVLDPNAGFWSLTSAIEGDALVLVALRGSMSQLSVQMQRMCCYRMQMPADLFDALPQRSLLRQSLLPHPAQDSLSMAERLGKMKEASVRLDRWYHSQDCPIESIFTQDVTVIRHVTDFASGAQATRCITFDDLRRQTRVSYGRERSKHVLGETHVPQHFLSMTQCYEVTRDSSGQPWRQSSIRVRVFDPLDNYKLKVGLILYSERDKFPNDQLPKNGALVKGPSACLNTTQPRPQASLPTPPHHSSPSPAPRAPGGPVKRHRVAEGRA